ncbi:hypothetical protein HanPI659440_Chr16g0634861 [Helianthus annuus]|nr:hypothetical protein HanPI659440_Chr16g0634861 [Helianthus annuus]
MNHQGRHFLYDNNEVELEKRRKRTSTAWVQVTDKDQAAAHLMVIIDAFLDYCRFYCLLGRCIEGCDLSFKCKCSHVCHGCK